MRTVDVALDGVLRELGDGQVDALAVACERHARASGSVAVAAAGAAPGGHEAVAGLLAAWRGEPELTGAGVALALRTGLAARRRLADVRSRPVWTGPGARGEERLTAGVLHELATSARHRVLLVSYAAFTLTALAADLRDAVGRGCVVDVVFETAEDSAGAYFGAQVAFGDLDGVRRWHWPADRRPPGAALHAKLLVVDGERALVGSANLTRRALAANLEAGLLVRDPAVAAALERHVRALMDHGVLDLEA